ncbi:MAG: hypothetical protein ACRDJC_01755 [Thermomicrobiales bacterium]
MHRLIALVGALVLVSGAGLLGISIARGQATDVPSPAQGHASVVAQGVAEMPAEDLAWRVTLASDVPVSDRPARATPGFLLVAEGSLLLSETDATGQTRLASGEAAFLPPAEGFQEALMGAGLGSYYRIDIVPATEVNDAASDAMVFVGQPFVSPQGSRDIDLVRDVLADGETVNLALDTQAAPVLFLVTAGTVELVPAGNETAAPVALPAGQGAALGGDVIVTATGGAGATLVTATIGPDVNAPLAQAAAPTATPLPQPATLAVQAFSCPPAYAGTDYATDCVEPVADVTFDLFSATGASGQGTTGGDGTVTFVELVPDTYSVTGGVPGEFAQQVVACADAAGPLPAEVSAAGATLTLGSGDAATCQWFVIPEDLQGEGAGTVSVLAFLCPGTPIDPAVDCAPTDASGAAITGPATSPSDTAEGVPFGTYALQTDGIAVPDGYQLSEVRGSDGAADTGWVFTVDESNPDAVLAVIYVPAGQSEGDADEDTDGLTDAQEAELGTDPANPDTDADGLFDGPELAVGTDPTLYDTDGDGFGDNQEAVSGSDPLDPGSVPEGDPGIDTDGDLLSDTEEEELGTNAATADSDGDGLSDFAEVGFEPGSATGTNPLVFDSDGDGVGDGAEVANGTDPTDPASS